MTAHSTSDSFGRLWEEAAWNPRRLLMIDYDGTVAPFTTDRLHAWPHPRTLVALSAIAAGGHTRVAVISGRPVHELVDLVGPLPVWLVGEHGWEVQSPEGDLEQYDLAPESLEGLRIAAERAIESGFGPNIEIKRSCLTLHVRGLSHVEGLDLQRDCERLWRPLTSIAALRIARINGGIELRALGRDKGTAVRDLMRWSGPDAMAVYLGDDDTDEDAFAQIAGRGLGILVSPESRPSLASSWLAGFDEVADFLDTWLVHVEGRGNGSRGAA